MFLSQRASVPFGGKKWNNLYNDLDLMEEVEKEWQKEEAAKELQIDLLLGIQKLLTKILDTDLQYGYEIARNTGFPLRAKPIILLICGKYSATRAGKRKVSKIRILCQNLPYLKTDKKNATTRYRF